MKLLRYIQKVLEMFWQKLFSSKNAISLKFIFSIQFTCFNEKTGNIFQVQDQVTLDLQNGLGLGHSDEMQVWAPWIYFENRLKFLVKCSYYCLAIPG